MVSLLLYILAKIQHSFDSMNLFRARALGLKFNS
jgi:hypothetical protein